MGFGYAATGYVGAALAAIGLAIFAISYRMEYKNPTAHRHP